MARVNREAERILVRPYSHDIDYELLVEGLRATGSFREGEDTPDRYIEVSRLAPDSILVATMGKIAVAGSVEIGTDRRVGEIRRLNVHPDHQRRGVGSALMRDAVRRLLEKDIKPELLVESGLEQTKGLLQFYRGLGFHIEYRAFGMSFEGSSEQPYSPSEYQATPAEAFTAIHDTIIQWPAADDFFLDASALDALLRYRMWASEPLQVRASYSRDLNRHFCELHTGHLHETIEVDGVPRARVWTAIETDNSDRYQLLHLVEVPWQTPRLELEGIGGLYIAHDLKSGNLGYSFVTEENDQARASIRDPYPTEYAFITEQLIKGIDYLDDVFRDSHWNMRRL